MKILNIFIIGVAISVAVFVMWPRKEHMPAQSKVITMQEIKVTSIAFLPNGVIPTQYTCDGKDISPPLDITGVPEETKTLALIMHDPDAPREGGWTHWGKYNVPWNMEHEIWNIEEGKEPEGVSGKGTGGELTYQGPCPPPPAGGGTHRYIFTVYALDTELTLKEGATKAELESAMQGHILTTGELIGLYSRKR